MGETIEQLQVRLDNEWASQLLNGSGGSDASYKAFMVGKVFEQQERLDLLEAVAEVACSMYDHYVPEDTMQETGWLRTFQAAGYLKEVVSD